MEPDTSEEYQHAAFPSRLVTSIDKQNGIVMLYTEVQVGHLAVSVGWMGPPNDPEIQRDELETILRTLNWSDTTGANPVPGVSIADDELQTDTLNNLLLVASTTHPSCLKPAVVWTELVDGGADSWVEDWYLNSCGALEVYDIVFVPRAGGGVDMALNNNPRILDGTDNGPDAARELLDPSVGAEQLGRLPWLVADAASTDEVSVATAVATARFHETDLYVWVLDQPPPEEAGVFAQATLESLGSGIMIVAGPDEVGYATAGLYRPADFDELFTLASQNAPNPTEFLMELVNELTRPR
jgi:hypothetical protein